jgi:hypothetical protein
MATSKVFVNALSLMPISELVMIICPVEEMGRNSVTPSTIAIMMAWIIVIRSVGVF